MIRRRAQHPSCSLTHSVVYRSSSFPSTRRLNSVPLTNENLLWQRTSASFSPHRAASADEGGASRSRGRQIVFFVYGPMDAMNRSWLAAKKPWNSKERH
jgi:hypothetical protein